MEDLTEVLPLPWTRTDDDTFAPSFLLRHRKYVSQRKITYVDIRRSEKNSTSAQVRTTTHQTKQEHTQR